MINQLFKTKVLSVSLLAFFFMLAVSGVNQLGAQTTIDATGVLSPSEMTAFEDNYNQLVDEVKNNPNYSETEVSVRLYFYDIIYQKVTYGYTIPEAIENSVRPTLQYAEKFKNGSSLDFEVIVEEAKQRLI